MPDFMIAITVTADTCSEALAVAGTASRAIEHDTASTIRNVEVYADDNGNDDDDEDSGPDEPAKLIVHLDRNPALAEVLVGIADYNRWYASTQIGKGHLHTAMAGTLPAALNQLTEQLR